MKPSTIIYNHQKIFLPFVVDISRAGIKCTVVTNHRETITTQKSKKVL